LKYNENHERKRTPGRKKTDCPALSERKRDNDLLLECRTWGKKRPERKRDVLFLLKLKEGKKKNSRTCSLLGKMSSRHTG